MTTFNQKFSKLVKVSLADQQVKNETDINKNILQSMTKTLEKNSIWTILCSCPLLVLNIVEEHRTKLASTNDMGSQHCIGGRGGVLKVLFKITIIFCH